LNQLITNARITNLQSTFTKPSTLRRHPYTTLFRSEATVTVGILLERRLELAQRWSRLTHLQQEFGEQLAHRIEAVLHRHMLDARVFAVGSRMHELHCLIARPFR